jgi:hypothetical protein
MATPEEIRRAREQSSIFSNLFDYVRANEAQLASEGRRPVLGGLLSKEPMMGTDTIRYEGLGPMLAGLLEPLARGVDAPRAAAQGLIPQEDMIGEAFGTAGTAMLGGGAVAKPSGALGANTLRVYHGTDADISQLDPNYGVTARDLYTTPVRSDAAEYGKNVLEFDVEGKIGNFLPEDRGISETRMLQTAYSDYGLDDYFDSFDDFVEAFDSGNMYQRFGSSAAQDEVVGALIDVGGFDAIRIPDAGFGGNMSESVVAQNPNVFKPVMANASKSAGLLSVASDVADRGDQILNMLKSGRGSEVTDAMLDMGDGVKNTQLNQYLAANYDLPMDEASRLARAREMGFEGGLLHGTGSDITAVDPAKLGGKQNVLGKGFYQTTNPERSDRYVPRVTDDDGSRVFAEGGNVMPLMTKSADEFDLTVPTGKENITRIANAFEGSDYDVELRDDGGSVFIKSKTDPNVSVFLDSYAEGQNTLMRLKDAFGNNNITPILQGAGFTGVKGVESRGSNVRVNYNPEDVRSQFARFDPRLSHLSNVTAANASPISGLLAQSGVSSEQAQRIEDYLYRTGLLQ